MAQKISEKEFDPKKHVKEYKRKCNECRKIWHSLTSREQQIEKGIEQNNCNQGAFACCNVGAAVQSKRNVEAGQEQLDKLRKCPECSSSNYKEEVIICEKK